MTEQEWLAAHHPGLMLTLLFGIPPDQWYDDDPQYPGTKPQIEGMDNLRKLRLFGCACCRRIWDELRSTKSKQAIELAEQYADGLTRGLSGWVRREWVMGWLMQAAQKEDQVNGWSISSLEWAPFCVLRKDLRHLLDAAWFVEQRSLNGEAKSQADLVRDIFGNPFRPVSLDPTWLAWNAGTVQKIAQAIYEERAFDRLPILADALEEAGCTNADILAHCRRPGEHVRGCWVLDLILGKA